MFAHLREQIEFGIKDGQIYPDIDPKVAAEMIIGTLRGMMLQRLVQDEVVTVDDIEEQMVNFVRRDFGKNQR